MEGCVEQYATAKDPFVIPEPQQISSHAVVITKIFLGQDNNRLNGQFKNSYGVRCGVRKQAWVTDAFFQEDWSIRAGIE
ncbi:hypothetical protein HanPI659440_Chr13g0513451 [Helianthus annuus]|nr:hypothetical protein HanPI659440_Chr13g0513451 [Helianthus annuus]